MAKATIPDREVSCERCPRAMLRFPSDPEPRWEPTPPYWNPHVDALLCRSCYWASMHTRRAPKRWRLED